MLIHISLLYVVMTEGLTFLFSLLLWEFSWQPSSIFCNYLFSFHYISHFFLLFFTGKVHGSLARAGKVRGQTPKVRRSLFPFVLSLSKTQGNCYILCTKNVIVCLDCFYRLTSRRRRRRRLAVPSVASSTTGASWTLCPPSERRRDPTPTPKRSHASKEKPSHPPSVFTKFNVIFLYRINKLAWTKWIQCCSLKNWLICMWNDVADFVSSFI